MFGRKKNGRNELLKRLFELGHSNEQVVNEILALVVGVTVEVSLGRCNLWTLTAGILTVYCLALTNVVNLLLDAEEHATFRTQAKSIDTKDLARLESHVIEALSQYTISALSPFFLLLRAGIDPPFAGVTYIAKKDHTVASLTVKQGEHLFLDVAAACMNVSRLYSTHLLSF